MNQASNKLILVVEDDPQNRKLFRDMLTLNGYRVAEATNGEEGVARAKALKPDLILMDVRMPIMDGLEAARLIRSDPLLKDTTIVALTASVMSPAEQGAQDAGCAGYITKPVSMLAFVVAVKKYCPP